MSQRSDRPSARGYTARGNDTEIDTSSKYEQVSADSPEQEVDQALFDFQNNDDDDNFHSDGHEDVLIDVVPTKSNHQTNFRYEENADGNVYLYPTGPKKARERLVNAMTVPGLILKPGELDVKDQTAIKYYNPGTKNVYWRVGDQVHFASRFLTEADTKPCHESMKRMQELLIKHPQSKSLPKGKKEGGVIALGISVEQGIGNIQPHRDVWPRKKKNAATRDCTEDPVTKELVQLFGSTVTKLMTIGVPEPLAKNIRARSAGDVSFRAGHEDNCFTNILQANVSLIDTDLEKSLGAGGGAHIDTNDDLGYVNIMIFLSNPPPGYCPGKCLLLNDRTYCVTAPFTALISTGAMPHWPIPPKKYDEDSIRHSPVIPTPTPSTGLDYRRITTVAYPHKKAMRMAPEKVKPIMKEAGSLLVYGTMRGQREYWTRLEGLEVQKKAKEQNNKIDASSETKRIRQKFSWKEYGKTQYPRKEVISEALFGPEGGPESEAAYQARSSFIKEHVHCGSAMPDGHRANKVKLVDEAGDAKSGNGGSEDNEKSSPAAKRTTRGKAKSSKKRSKAEVEDNGDEGKPPAAKKARKARGQQTK